MNKKDKKAEQRVILLEDLIPRKRVTGGSGKILFGERTADSSKNAGVPKEQKKDTKKQ